MLRIVVSFVFSCLLGALSLHGALGAESNPFAGVWTLNLGKSKADSGALPKSEMRTYGTNIEGAVTMIAEGIDLEGMPYAYGATGDINGRNYPVPGRDVGARILGDSISWRRIDSRTVEMTVKKKGDIINTTRHAVSEDGKTLTISENGMDDEGRPVRQTRVYDRQ